jgi:hypothetical protein
MRTPSFRTSAFFAALVVAASVPVVVNCGSTELEEDQALSEDDIGVNNASGLGLRFDESSGSIQATLKRSLDEGERLVVRIRGGKITSRSQADLNCGELIETEVLGRDASGKVAFQGPKVERAMFELLKLYNDPRWATLDVSSAQLETARKTPDAMVEACLVKNGKPRAKLVTHLAYAFDQGTKDYALRTRGESIGLQAGDGGLAASDAGAPASDGGAPSNDGGSEPARVITEENVAGQIEYSNLCEKDLGEIPFFPKIKDGSYETFDCRDLVANGKDGNQPRKLEGIEGANIPARVDGKEVTVCDPGRELGPGSSSYGCIAKTDEGMYLKSGLNQPGAMVVSAKNSKGSHWTLLCRAVADDGKGMMKTKTFNDIAMIGHNPRTGRTCFFQNKIGSGDDGSKVAHPGDVDKSSTIWSGSPQSFCSGDCHGNSPFLHSKWIDGARRSNGKTVVPMAGQHPDLPISAPIPYNLVAGDRLGFALPKISRERGSQRVHQLPLAFARLIGS